MKLGKTQITFIASLYNEKRLAGDCNTLLVGSVGDSIHTLVTSDDTTIVFATTASPGLDDILAGPTGTTWRLFEGFHIKRAVEAHSSYSMTKKEFTCLVSLEGMKSQTIEPAKKPGSSEVKFPESSDRSPSWTEGITKVTGRASATQIAWSHKLYDVFKRMSDNGRHAVSQQFWKYDEPGLGCLVSSCQVDSVHLGVVSAIRLTE